MSVTTTTWGNHTVKLTYTAGSTIAEIKNAVENFITAHGWATHDANAGADCYVYKAINLDATTYKYLHMDYSFTYSPYAESVNGTLNGILLTAYETWDENAHTGTNPSAYMNVGAGSVPIRILLDNPGEIFVNCNARWLFMLDRSNGAYRKAVDPATEQTSEADRWSGAWPAGIVEITRDHSNDTPLAGYPCWGIYDLIGVGSIYCPRLRDETTSTSALLYTAIANGIHKIDWWTKKPMATTIYVSNNTVGLQGRIVGAKHMMAGEIFSSVFLKVDANYFLSNSGTLTEHIFFGGGGRPGPTYYGLLLPK